MLLAISKQAYLKFRAQVKAALRQGIQLYTKKQQRRPIEDIEQLVAVQSRKAEAFLTKAISRLCHAGWKCLAEIVLDLYPRVLPYLVKGRDGNPVHHTAYVVDVCSEIALGEKLNLQDTGNLTLAALFHDSGLGDAMRPKITEETIARASQTQRAHLRASGIAARKEHMQISAQLLVRIFQEYEKQVDREKVAFLDLKVIRNIVSTHDNSKIPLLLEDDADFRPWLIQPPSKQGADPDRLKQLHWEADAMWMVSKEGLLWDMRNQQKKDTRENRRQQLYHNLGLHSKVVELYRKAYTKEEMERFGFKDGMLYRSKTGYAIVQRLRKEILQGGNSG